MKLCELLDSMTFEEKCSLLTGAGSMLTARVERLGVPQRLLSDGPHGVRMEGKTEAVHFPNACTSGASWDEALMEKTGGIVQGMSGSPILQNGRIVGAVTHVCVNP